MGAKASTLPSRGRDIMHESPIKWLALYLRLVASVLSNRRELGPYDSGGPIVGTFL